MGALTMPGFIYNPSTIVADANADPTWTDRRAGETELQHGMRLWCLEHARIGPFGYWPLVLRAIRNGTEVPEMWFPPEGEPMTEEVLKEWLRRANEFMSALKAAYAELAAS